MRTRSVFARSLAYVVLLASISCSEKPTEVVEENRGELVVSRAKVSTFALDLDAEALVAERDENGNGAIDREEAFGNYVTRWSEFDRNADGLISSGELLAVATRDAALGNGPIVEMRSWHDNRPRGVTVRRSEGALGSTLLAPASSKSCYLVDLEGRIEREWTGRSMQGGPAELLPDGRLLRSVFLSGSPIENPSPSSIAGGIELFAASGELQWEYSGSSDMPLEPFGLEMLPNGNVLAIARRRLDFGEARALGVIATSNSRAYPGNVLVEIKPYYPKGGTVVWTWDPSDHFVQDRDAALASYGSVSESPHRIDPNYGKDRSEALRSPAHGASWTLIRDVEYDAARDAIWLAVPSHDEIWLLSRPESSLGISGRWGNPKAWKGGPASAQLLFSPSEVRLVPEGLPGGGNLMVASVGFLSASDPKSNIYELSVRRADSPGAMDVAIAWRYESPAAPFPERNVSGVQRLSSGLTLVRNGNSGRIAEIDSSGSVKWEYFNDLSSGSDLRARGLFSSQRLE